MNIPINSLKGVGTRVLGRGLLFGKKYAPEILTATGITGVVVAAVMASKATLKLEPVVDKIEEGVTIAKSNKELLDAQGTPIHSDLDYKKDLAYAYSRGTVAVIRLYGPSVTLGVASIGCILGAHGILRKRNAALVVAYKAIETSFSEYRKRVVEIVGEDQERDIHYGIRTEEVAVDGKKVIQATVDPTLPSTYAKFFDEGNKHWKPNPETNMLFLRCQQNYANDILRAKGHIFLNEVYDMIGVDRTGAGQFVGWKLGKNGDNLVDFNLYDFSSEQGRAFINGYERNVLLDFNVDGIIYDLIEE